MTGSKPENNASSPHDNQGEPHQTSEASKGASTGTKNLIFFSVICAVVGFFFYLSSFDGPPDLPSNAIHGLRFNLDGDLVGLGERPEPDVDASGKRIKKDKKSIEKRVNLQCAACHGTMKEDLTNHPCQTVSKKCLPENHPPKETCIKCHRSAKGATNNFLEKPGSSSVAPKDALPSAPQKAHNLQKPEAAPDAGVGGAPNQNKDDASDAGAS